MEIFMCLNLKATHVEIPLIFFLYTIQCICFKRHTSFISYLAGHFRRFLSSLDIERVCGHLHALPFNFSLQISFIVFLEKIKHAIRALK